MTVGAGEDYRSAGAAPPSALHPNAPVTPATIGAALQAAYSIAHFHGRCLGRSCVGRVIGTALPAPVAYSSYTTIPIARWWPRVPDEVRSILAVVDFDYTFASPGTAINHRVVVTDGSATDTGTARQIQPSQATTQIIDPGQSFLAISEPVRRTRVLCSVDLANVTDNQRLSVQVQAEAGSLTRLRHLQCAIYWVANG